MPGTDDLPEAVAACQAHPEALAELRRIFQELDAVTAQASPVCLGGGCCCRFALAGHRLYASTLEIALLIMENPADSDPQPLCCAYQRGPLCHARDARPLGCRTFFCRADESWSQRIYEQMHTRIRLLHKGLSLPYQYREVTGAIAKLLSQRE